MISFPRIDPSIIELGPFKLRWYGLMYVLGFLSAYFLIGAQEKARRLGLQGKLLQDLIFYMGIGIGGGCPPRLYPVLPVCKSGALPLASALEIIAVWHGGMSFHGGLIGVVAATILFCRIHDLPFLRVADTVIVTAPPWAFSSVEWGILLTVSFTVGQPRSPGPWFFHQAPVCRGIHRSFTRPGLKAWCCLLFCGRSKIEISCPAPWWPFFLRDMAPCVLWWNFSGRRMPT